MRSTYSQLVESIIEFVQLLRKAGIKTGTGVAIKTAKALALVSLNKHDEFYWALKASLITDHLDDEIFNQLFALYWGSAKLPDSALAVSLPRSKVKSKAEKSFSKRTLDAFERIPEKPRNQETQLETLHLSWSDKERLQRIDFESMASEEFLQAQKLLLKMKVMFRPEQSRRFQSSSGHKKIDFRKSLKASSKYNLELIDLKYKKPKLYYPPLIIFIDISGSMSRYSQIMLQFSHLLNAARNNVHVFLFATRLTPVSSELRYRDIDDSLKNISEQVNDWNSGTRIGECIKSFNNNYLRRIINSKSKVLFITDGLDRGDQALFDKHIFRLKRSCKNIVWLNPLLRYEDYEPKTKGALTLLPYVDAMLPIHNLISLEQLIDFLHLNINNPLNKAA